MLPPVLDACCGAKMMWFDKNNPVTLFLDERRVDETLCDGRQLVINPDMVGDFRAMSFPDNSFSLVLFDPPHMIHLGQKSWLAKKYGTLLPTWREDLRAGFEECFRVLKPYGVLVFKWSEAQIKAREVIELSPEVPLFGSRSRGKVDVIWFVFMKGAAS